MGKRRFLVSLMTDDNAFQIEQASSAEQAAARLGVEIQIVYAENDAKGNCRRKLSRCQALSRPLKIFAPSQTENRAEPLAR
jgi:hypothetical protein